MPRGDDPPVLRPAILLRSPQSTPCVPLLLCAIDFSVPLGLSFLGPFRRPVRGSPRDFRFAPPPLPSTCLFGSPLFLSPLPSRGREEGRGRSRVPRDSDPISGGEDANRCGSEGTSGRRREGTRTRSRSTWRTCETRTTRTRDKRTKDRAHAQQRRGCVRGERNRSEEPRGRSEGREPVAERRRETCSRGPGCRSAAARGEAMERIRTSPNTSPSKCKAKR